MKLKRLPPDEFDGLPAKTRFQDQARSILRAVLADGRTQADVATEFGVSVHRLMGFFKNDYIEQAATTGTALVSVTLEMPENLALEVTGLLGCTEWFSTSLTLSPRRIKDNHLQGRTTLGAAGGWHIERRNHDPNHPSTVQRRIHFQP